jgi:dynactin 1
MPEQQLGHAYNVDCDLDNFAAAVGFARQAVLGLAGDEGELPCALLREIVS